MALFMINWVSVSFLWLLVISDSDCLEGQDFIDLSQFDYSAKEILDGISITFVNNPEFQFEMKCPNCEGEDSIGVYCEVNESVETIMQMKQKGFQISFPFNISCNAISVWRNTFMISDIDIRPGVTDISMSWTPPTTDIYHYLVIVMNSSHVYTKRILSETSYKVKNLEEKSWHQICIASINKMWRTSRFKCKKVLMGFYITGPVTNVTAISESDWVYMSWSRPEYKYDIPQGYIIYLKGRTNQMCRLYIIKRQPDIDPVSQYSCVNTETITSLLSSLEIKDLPPNSEFTIEISSFNRNKKSTITHLTIKTKEGGSGPIKNLKVDLDSDPHNIHISFDARIHPEGVILKYRIRVILKRINICTSSNDVIHEANTTNIYSYIPKSVMKKCGSYVLEVDSLYGWNSNNVVGKTASVPFHYSMDQQSTLSIETKFVVSDTLIFSIGNLKGDKCENFGFIVDIENEKNPKNRLVRIISNLDCEEFKKKYIRGKRGDRHLVKYDNRSSIYEFPISTGKRFKPISIVTQNVISNKVSFFIRESRYIARVYKIANEVIEVKSVKISTEEIKDCFSDCYNKGRLYAGIRSVLTNEGICKMWKETNYSTHMDLRSNICSSVDRNRPGCFNKDNNLANCDIPECSDISQETGCVTILFKTVEIDSVRIEWYLPPSQVAIIGYLVLLHNSDHFCERAIIQLCDNCGNMTMLGKEIKSLYLSCQSIRERQSASTVAIFTYLHQNRKYNVYIVPIMTYSKVGLITPITVYTKLAKPDIPSGITYKLDTLRKIEFSWPPNIETESHGFADNYEPRLKDKIRKGSFGAGIKGTSIKFDNLQMCTEYCFVLSSSNLAGNSDLSKEICTFTLAPKPEISVLADLRSEYMRNQSLNWTYLGSDNCRRTYRVEYHVKFSSEAPLYTLTNTTSILLTGLTPNVIYTVRVRAEGQMKTINNDFIGAFSLPREFFTGKLQPKLSYYLQNLDHTNKELNISWGIEEEIRESIFMYIIQVKNSTESCMYSVFLACNACREPWTWNNVRDKHEESVMKLMNCTVSLNGTLDANQTSFNYLFTSEKQFGYFFVEIYGVDLMGIHLLNNNSDDSSRSTLFLILLIIVVTIVAFLLLFMILVLIKLKRRPSSLNGKKNDVKRDQSFMMKRNNKPKRTKSINTTDETIREKMVLNRQLRRLTDPNLWPIQDFGKLNNKMNISGFFDYYKEVSEHEGVLLINQYKKLTKASKAQEATLELTVSVGKDSENLKKNQFLNIIPYDQNRVKIGKKRPPLDYINASYIPFENDETQIEYIAAQGPIECTLSDFWKMIWEQNVHCIVMLTRTKENDKFKCLQYWPNDTEESVSYGNHNQFNVSLVKEDVKEVYVERELRVLNKKCNDSRKILQLHMRTWPDHSAPNLNFFDKFLYRFHEITNEEKLHPFLVHCSAGVGRTGTMICIDRIIKHLISGVKEIRIYDTILKLRQYRNFLVQQEAQYIFIHEYINHFLEKYKKLEGVEDNIYFNDD